MSHLRTLLRGVSAGKVLKRLRALLTSFASASRLLLAHRDLASRIHIRNAAQSGQARTDANDPNRSFESIASIQQLGPGVVLGVAIH